jgi:hypothetical protein
MARPRSHRSSARAAARLLLVALAVAGCGVGTGTLRIEDAEAEIVSVAEEIARVTGVTLDGPLRSAPLEQCQLRSGGAGLRTRVEVRGVLPAGGDGVAAAFDAAAAVLIARGLVLVESGVPGTLLGQRDGLTVTVGSDGRVLEIDALTGCRPR